MTILSSLASKDVKPLSRHAILAWEDNRGLHKKKMQIFRCPQSSQMSVSFYVPWSCLQSLAGTLNGGPGCHRRHREDCWSGALPHAPLPTDELSRYLM